MVTPLRSFPVLLVALLMVSGCAAYGADILYRTPTPDRSSGPSPNRVERDVRSYVKHLDRELKLNRRQERAIERALLGRTDHLMRTTRGGERSRVYPFPRRYDQYPNRATMRFWQLADRDIEQSLSRRQVTEFRRMKDGRDHRRYEDRRRSDRRYDVAPRRPHVRQ